MAKYFYIYYVSLLWLGWYCCMLITPAICSQSETDQLALVSFKNAIDQDPFGVFRSWNNSLHFCDWEGVSCNGRNPGRVISLNLTSKGLVGSLSPHIGNLSFLNTIMLQNNNLHGHIPGDIGRLFWLQTLELSNNSFTGEVPCNLSFCENLNYLNLIDNKLVGEIPAALGSLHRLQYLGLGHNNLLGNIPSSLGNLSNLFHLSLDRNTLHGQIPDEFSKLRNIVQMRLSENKLTGKVPSGIYNVSSHAYFSMSNNQLQGNIPFDIFFTLPNLIGFDIGFNLFTGTIPVSLCNISTLEIISFASNHFTGKVPKDFGRLATLRGLDLSANTLEDDLTFLDSLTNCSQLERIEIQINSFRGPLPYSIANLSTKLTTFNVTRNQLRNTIPSGIENLFNLRVLGLSNNYLTGPIPTAIGKLSKLEYLGMEKNNLTGEIPSSFGNLTKLSVLIIGFNNLNGMVPPSLGDCQMLLRLDLSHNNLTGWIPPEVISLSSISIIFSLANNELSGSLPSEVGLLTNLAQLDLSNNQLSGRIPNSLGSCEILEQLYLQGNSFEGNIPQSFSLLRGLRELDISHNNLSGKIPVILAKLPGLNHLNISFNQLEGEVPRDQVFSDLSSISVSGNHRLCGGIPELKLPSCPKPHAKKIKLPRPIKIIILVLVAVASCYLLFGFFIILWRKKAERKEDSLPQVEQQFLRLSYADLFTFTYGFAEATMIGLGSYGMVFKGILRGSGMAVAVKVLNLHRKGASRSFLSECEVLRSIRHRNLLKLLSVCSSVDFQGNDFKALVYEYMPNGNLDRWLHHHRVGSRRLKLMERINIAIDIACAVDYLHNGRETTIIHGDLKPSNVLLDAEMVAHVGDFGLSKTLSIISGEAIQQGSSSFATKGSTGYVAPEYGMTHRISKQGDIYSYGILLLEMFTGKQPIDDLLGGVMNLHSFVKRSLPDGFIEIVDPSFLEEEEYQRNVLRDSVIDVLRIGVTCSEESPRDRMEIWDVIGELQAIRSRLAVVPVVVSIELENLDLLLQKSIPIT